MYVLEVNPRASRTVPFVAKATGMPVAKLAAKAARTGREQIILNQSDRTRFGVKIAAQANELLTAAGRTGELTLAAQSQPMQGGLLLSDGAVDINCALETLVRLSRTEVTGEVSKLLFA